MSDTTTYKIKENIKIDGKDYKFFSGDYDFTESSEDTTESDVFGTYDLHLSDNFDEITIIDNFYNLYTKTLEQTVNLEHFKGKYWYFIKRLDKQATSSYRRFLKTEIANARKNKKDYSPKTFNDVEMIAKITYPLQSDLNTGEIKRADVKTLFDSFVKELVKN